MTLFYYCWNLLLFALVTVSFQYWPSLPTYPWLIALLLVSAFLWRVRTIIWFAGVIVGIGVCSLHGHLYRVQTDTLFQTAENITINGKVNSFFKKISHGNEYSFIVERINGDVINYFARPQVRLIVPNELQLAYGERWQFAVKVKPVLGRLNEAGFDLERYYAGRRWSGRVVVDAQGAFRLQRSSSLRYIWYTRVRQLTEGLAQRALILALGFGEREEIVPEMWQKLRSSGLSHLVAISGLHIGMAFAFAWYLTRAALSLVNRSSWLPVIAGVLMAAVYAWLAGFSITTLRAVFMCLVLVGLEWLHLRVGRWIKLLTVLCLLLFIDPFVAFADSFWLSFSAVAAVYLVVTNRRVMTMPLWLRLIALQCGLALWMLPASILFFDGVSLLSPLYNLVYVPLFSLVIVPLVFVGLALTLAVPPLALYNWRLVSYLLEGVEWSLHLSAGFWLQVSYRYQVVVVLFVAVLLLFPLLSPRQKLVAGLLLFCWPFTQTTDSGWRVDVLDVGQGLAVLISSGGGHLLYDTGNRWPGGSIAQSVIAPILHRRGVTQLEGLFISHIDSDHAGGRTYVEQHFNPALRWSSQLIPGYTGCKAGERWQWRGLTFEMLWPPRLVERAYNAHSCVIRVSDGQSSVLLAGDIVRLSEYLLLRQERELSADIIVVPHHGSATSSSAAFIRRVAPKLAVASLARGNQWNMPSPAVVQRYVKQGCRWLDTGKAGQVSLIFSQQGWRAETGRNTQSNTWYRQMLRKGVE